MATYRVTAPDGATLRVNAPDDASEEAVMRYAQAQWKGAPKLKAPDVKYDPTEGMSFFEKAAAGVGKSIYDTGRGIGQMLGMVSREEVDEARKRDAALMNTGAGMGGNIAGNLAQAVFLPGGSTVKGATLIGGALGAAQPVGTDESRLQTLLSVLVLVPLHPRAPICWAMR